MCEMQEVGFAPHHVSLVTGIMAAARRDVAGRTRDQRKTRTHFTRDDELGSTIQVSTDLNRKTLPQLDTFYYCVNWSSRSERVSDCLW